MVVDLIAATTTGIGLTVRAERDPATYPKGIKVTDAELVAVPREPHRFHGEWNYTVGGKRMAARPRRTPRILTVEVQAVLGLGPAA